MTIKEIFQSLGQSIGQGWASLKSHLFSHSQEAHDGATSNPLLERSLSESTEDGDCFGSTTAMTGKLIDVSEQEVQPEQPQSDFDMQAVPDGIVKVEPSFGQKVVLYASSIFSRSDRHDAEEHAWLDKSATGSKKGFVKLSEEAEDTRSGCKML